MKKMIFFVISILVSQNLWAQISELRFLSEMLEHRAGILLVCEEVMMQFPAFTKNTNYQAYMRDRCRHHDDSKVIQSREFIKRHGLPENESMARRLSRQYGHTPDEEGKKIIQMINKVDDQIAMDLSMKHKIPVPIQKQADMIEKISDLVARYTQESVFHSPQEPFEFGRPLIPASEYFKKESFLKDFGKNDQDLLVRTSKQFENSGFAERYKQRILVNRPWLPSQLQEIQKVSIFPSSRPSHPIVSSTLKPANSNPSPSKSSLGSLVPPGNTRCLEGLLRQLEQGL